MENTDDLKKYFDSKQYRTTLLGIDSEEIEMPVTKEDKITSLISLLTDPANKDVKEIALVTLKKEKGGDTLLLAIASPKAKNVRHLLVAACWESEINFSKYLPFFILLALDEDYLISLEAITTIENMEGPFVEADVKEAIKKVKAAKNNITTEKAVLLNDLVVTLEGFLEK
ncbi:MAG: hypothetical protein ACXVPY_11395 [Bacteroidia bacterium]